MLNVELTGRQQRIVASALTLISLVAIGTLVVWLSLQVLAFFAYFSGVFLPLAVAGILATLMKPFYQVVHARTKSAGLAVSVVILSVILPLGFILSYFGVVIAEQLSAFISALPAWLEKVELHLQERLPVLRDWIAEHDLRGRLSAMLEGRGEMLAKSAAALGKGVVSTGSAMFATVAGALGWVVLPIYFVYLLQAPSISRDKLEELLPFLNAETRRNVVYLATEFVNILVAFFRGQLVVAFCQGGLFAVGFALAGLPYGVILGLLLGFLNIIPYLGNIVGLAVVLPLAWFHPDGGATMLAFVIGVFVLVQCIEGYVLTPRIMGKTTGLHPLAIIVAILFWGTAFSGLLGMILAIPLTAFLVVFWRLLRERYFNS